VTVGDILTIWTILITLGAGLISFERDRPLQETEQANKVRAAHCDDTGEVGSVGGIVEFGFRPVTAGLRCRAGR